MSDTELETFTHKGVRITIKYDSNPEHANPRDGINVGVMLANGHGRYTLGDESFKANVPDYDTAERALKHFMDRLGGGRGLRTFTRWLTVFGGSTVVLPLYLLDHSGLSMSTGTFASDPGGWDSGVVGVIFDTPHTREQTGCDPERIEEALRVEVKYYSACLEGQVVGWEAEIGMEFEQCWGYVLGSDDFSDLENVRSEAKATAEVLAKQHRKAKKAKKAAKREAKALADAHRPVAVLDIETLQERWDDNPESELAGSVIEALKALPPATLRQALADSIGDFFWQEMHSVMDTATEELLKALPIPARLEYLRGEIRAERISYAELVELRSLAPHIQPGDVELLEAAGVPESPTTDDPKES